jgi:hypothetical protein
MCLCMASMSKMFHDLIELQPLKKDANLLILLIIPPESPQTTKLTNLSTLLFLLLFIIYIITINQNTMISYDG